jgi:PAS domain S-box-containing protein
MKQHSEKAPDWEEQRDRIIGLGETSIRKSYYPELQQRIIELEKKNRELAIAYEDQMAVSEELRQQCFETAKTEQQLRESEEKYRRFVETANEGILSMDPSFNIIFANQRIADILGYAIDEMRGRKISDFMDPLETPDIASGMKERISGFHEVEERKFIHRDGSERWLQVSLTATSGPTGDLSGSFAMITDITKRKEAEVALQQARNKLKLLNAITFQDIHTAAFSISAYQHLIRDMVPDEAAKEYFEREDLLLKKIVNTLDFAKNYQQMGIRSPCWQNVHQVFLLAISHLDFRHMKHSIELDDLEVFADPLLEKAMENIFQNVLEHGEHATEVTLGYEDRGDHLILVVRDNGTGIPPEEKNMIFDRGYGRGTGLGLFFVREVLSITHITIHENGIPGQGARFEISVPRGAYQFPSRMPAG